MVLFKCGTESIQFLYPFITPIGIFIQALGYATMSDYYNHWLFFSNLIFLAETSCGLLTFIARYKTKKRMPSSKLPNRNSNNKEEPLELKYLLNPQLHVHKSSNYKNFQTTPKKHLLFLAIPAFFDFLQYNLLSLYCGNKGIQLNGLQEDVKNSKILFCLILCVIFLRTPIYKHQIIAIIITVIGVVINVIFICISNSSDIDNNKLSQTDFIKGIFFFFLTNTIYSAKSVSEKYFMEKYKIYPFDVLLYQGLLGLTINILALIPAYFISCEGSRVCINSNEPNACKCFDPGKLKEALSQREFWNFASFVYGGDLILYGFSVWTNYYFSPTHLNIAEGISTVLMWITTFIVITFNISFLDNYQTYDYRTSWKPIIGNSLIIFGTLIYNEIIILNCFGLETFTKKEIKLRGENEAHSLVYNNVNLISGESIDNNNN